MSQPIDILLIEDNPGDVRLTQEVLKEAQVETNLVVVEDGVEALACLRREGPYRDSARPELVLLDLNLPRLDGREVLAQMKRDRQLRSIPVIVLTTSQAEEDVSTSYQLSANCFISKPADLDRFSQVVTAIKSFWLDVATLPPEGNGQAWPAAS